MERARAGPQRHPQAPMALQPDGAGAGAGQPLRVAGQGRLTAGALPSNGRQLLVRQTLDSQRRRGNARTAWTILRQQTGAGTGAAEAAGAAANEQAGTDLASEVTAAIQETLRAYEQMEIETPDGDSFTVRPVYWINENPHDSSEQAAAEAAALTDEDQRERSERRQRNREARWDRHGEAVSALGGTDRVPRSVLQRVLNGKATPGELQRFIQAAVHEAGEAERRRASLPRAPRSGAAGEWERSVGTWINRYGIGLDCSMFVFEAERRVRERLHGAEAAEAWAAQWVSRPGGRALISGGDEISAPSDLQPGDIMQIPGHVRVVSGARREGEWFRFTTAESGSSVGRAGAGGGPGAREWRLPVDADDFSGLELLRGETWRSSRESPSFYRRADVQAAE